MNRIRNTITATIFCLLMALSGAGPLAAAEPQDDEKITMPKGPPASPGPGGISPPGGVPGRGDLPVPRPATPDGSGTTIIVPTPSPLQVTPPPGETAVVPPLPGTSPSDTTSPVEVLPVVPAVPVLPQPPDRIVQIPDLRQETAPQKESTVPPDVTPKPEPPAVLEPDKQPSLMDFLLTTPLAPDKAPSEPLVEKDKQPDKAPSKTPDKARPEEPKAQPPLKAEQAKPKPGDPLSIPPDAAKTGDLSFLEGCWRGTRPEYNSKRIINERFCFDKNGSGKRTIEDPRYAGTCTGATKGSFDAQGKLIVTSELGYCTKGAMWGPAYMICQGEGNSTPCYWRFPGVGGASQSYKIPFVRE